FVGGVPSKTYKLLNEYERRPLLDKALTGLFPPGSTFKMTTALSLLAAGIDPKERVHCSGGYFFGNRTFRCWKKGGHGSQDMHNAIKNSCDVYFYHMCNRAGVDRIAQTARALGFEQKFSERDFGSQKKGLVPDTAWKKKTFKRDPKWHPGETLSVSIGQGALQVNALQLAVMCARLANTKKAVMPRLVRSIAGKPEPSGAAVPDLPFPQEHLDIVRAGMAAVANDVTGTAYRASQLGLGDILMAGKTGTAQSRSYKAGESRGPRNAQWSKRDHALFVAFAPHDDPRYAISVIIQHAPAGGSADAAPRAREVMRTALIKDPDMRARIERPIPQQAAPAPEAGGGEPDVFEPQVETAPPSAPSQVVPQPAPAAPATVQTTAAVPVTPAAGVPR
ncbi:MAG TPA: penicillin-binding transpeptidase domain-containing protein, partial [Caulobacteraceae bacterium]|nr:penicillin-binding transpeptidase domain-containing protein [Caulobacteraceae bacterium]